MGSRRACFSFGVAQFLHGPQQLAAADFFVSDSVAA